MPAQAAAATRSQTARRLLFREYSFVFFRGLLSRTGRNLEIDEFRKAERRPRQVSIDGRQIEDEGSDAAERETLFRKVEASVDSELTDLQKIIVRKHEYEGQSFERIAKDLGMRQEAVRMHISRARKILRDKFRNETDE